MEPGTLDQATGQEVTSYRTPPLDRQTPGKILPCPSFEGGKKPQKTLNVKLWSTYIFFRTNWTELLYFPFLFPWWLSSHIYTSWAPTLSWKVYLIDPWGLCSNIFLPCGSIFNLSAAASVSHTDYVTTVHWKNSNVPKTCSLHGECSKNISRNSTQLLTIEFTFLFSCLQDSNIIRSWTFWTKIWKHV